MIAKIISQGRGVRGLVAYTTHDATSPADRKPQTAERVSWIHGLNLPTDDPELAGLIMGRTVRDGPGLKEQAGIGPGGRKLKSPFMHVSFSWAPGERPSRGDMTQAAEEGLKAIGMGGCEAVLAAHHDRDHLHVHAAVCRVHPETGRACGNGKGTKVRLSKWAEKYERSRGQILIPGRVERHEARERYNNHVKKTAIAAGMPQHEAKVEAREKHPLPPMKRGRCPGRQAPTPPEQAQWRELYERQRSRNTQPREARAERAALAKTFRESRIGALVRWPVERIRRWRSDRCKRKLERGILRTLEAVNDPLAQDAARAFVDLADPSVRLQFGAPGSDQRWAVLATGSGRLSAAIRDAVRRLTRTVTEDDAENRPLVRALTKELADELTPARRAERVGHHFAAVRSSQRWRYRPPAAAQPPQTETPAAGWAASPPPRRRPVTPPAAPKRPTVRVDIPPENPEPRRPLAGSTRSDAPAQTFPRGRNPGR